VKKASDRDEDDSDRGDGIVVVGSSLDGLGEIVAALAPLRPSVQVLGQGSHVHGANSVPDHPRLLVLDLRTSASSRTSLLPQALDRWPEPPIIVVAAMHLAKLPPRVLQLAGIPALVKVVHALDQRLPDRAPARLNEPGLQASIEVEQMTGPDGILGESAAVRDLRVIIAKAAPTNASVLITGESGVGKERVARLLHRLSARRDGPFVGADCGAFTESLLASELFGHKKGAFTDARHSRCGLLLAASGGTLFLDEVGEMSPGLQVKLLRSLQERTVRPVGADDELVFDARVIAATNQPIERLLVEKRLREDLYFRIAVILIDVPPLRERGGDILALAEHFAREFAAAGHRNIIGFSASAQELLQGQPWPGNVRQLKNCIERAVAMGSGPLIDSTDIVIRETPPAGTPQASHSDLAITDPTK
jgi:DNA-binding NtrC family response regulator